MSDPRDGEWVDLGGAWAVYWPDVHPCVREEDKRGPWVVFVDPNWGGGIQYATDAEVHKRLKERL